MIHEALVIFGFCLIFVLLFGGVEGLPFWDDHAKAFGSTIPSIDRIEASKDYHRTQQRPKLHA